MKKNRVLIIILISVFQGIFSQYLDMKFIDPFIELDLSNKSVNCIAQDTTGFIWIGTKNGLISFNGYEVKTYQHNYIDTTTLLSHDIKSLFIDGKGRFWIGFNNGLCLYNPLKDNFQRFAHINDSCGLNNFEIIAINEDHNEKLYIANAFGLYQLNEKTQTFQNVYTLEKGEMSSFLFDKQNNIWIGTYKEGGLIKINSDDSTVLKYFHNSNNPNSLSNNSPVSIALQGDTLWIATYEGGVNRLDINSGLFKHYLINTVHDKYSRFIYVDREDRVWEADITSLKIYDKLSDSFIGYYPNTNDPYSIKHVALGIFQDKQMNYWTYHANDGVCLRVVPKGFNYFNTTPERFWYTSFKSISAISNDSEGNLWVGNSGNGINVFRWANARIEVYNYDAGKKNCLGPGTVHCIYRSNSGQMWIGTYRGGLQYFDYETRQFFSYLNNPEDSFSIANNDVRSIAEDREGDLWIVTHGKGIDKFDIKTKKFQHYTKNSHNLSNDYAFQVLTDRNDNIWVATVWGLSYLKKGEVKFKNYYYYPDVVTSLNSNEINCLYEDEKGQIWIGTSAGLNIFHPIDSNFIRYDNGFINKNIGSILSDKKGNIWVGTADGISVLDPLTGFVQNFDKSDGLIISEMNARSCFKTGDNSLHFGGIEGLVIFKPENLKYNDEPPKVVITKMKLFNEEIMPDDEHSVLEKNIVFTDNIKLKHNQKVITFSYAAINFINPHKNKYKYKMEGFDQDWVDAGYKREVTYTNLDPGRYVFRVIASNNDFTWNNEGTFLNITITPPWWRTFFFKIVIIALIIMTFFLINYFRTDQLRKQKRALENRVKERTSELEHKNELLEKQTEDLNNINTLLEERQQHIEEQTEELKGQAERLFKINEELKQANSTKNKLFSIIAHDLKDPFNTILGFSDYLTEEFENIDEAEKKKILLAINSSSKRVHALLDNLLKWSRSQTETIAINKREINVLKLVQNSYYVLKNTISNKNLEVMFDIPEDLEINVDENTMQIVFRNLINNAVKFTPSKGAIAIKAHQLKDKVAVSIIDTGIGMPKEILDNLFNSEKNKIQVGTDGEKGSGLGLLICKEFTELNGGKLTVSSEQGKGSIFIVTLPSTTVIN